MNAIKKLFYIVVLTLIVSGCTAPNEKNNSNNGLTLNNMTTYSQQQALEGNPDSTQTLPAKKTTSVYTSERVISLTFNGLPEADKLTSVLNLLNQYNIKATFFVPGQRIAEEPELADYILEQGHTLENNSLNKKNLNNMTYNEIFNELTLSKQTIEALTSVLIKYVRAETVQFEEPVLKATSQSGHERYIGYSLFLTDEYLRSKFRTAIDLRKYITRGAIVAIDLERNTNISQMLQLLSEAVNEVNYTFVTLDKLIAAELPHKPYYEIEGFDLAQINPNYTNQQYNQFDSGPRYKKQIALTIDDWGTDYTVTRMLDIFAEEQVVTTFFLRANGVENNPSLARAILDAGHEIANHTYSHPVITTISAQDIQKEVVNAHHILTEALQQPPSMLFRPPTGAIDDKSAKIVAATGYKDIAMYDITTLDWKIETTADDIFRIISENVTNGSIILLHMLDDINTLEALPKVISFLKQEGYQFVTTTELMK